MKTLIGLWKNWKNVPMDVKLLHGGILLGVISCEIAIGVVLALDFVGLSTAIIAVAGCATLLFLVNGFTKELIMNWLPKKGA